MNLVKGHSFFKEQKKNTSTEGVPFRRLLQTEVQYWHKCVLLFEIGDLFVILKHVVSVL